MKKIIIMFVVLVLARQFVQAQGTTTYLSNLGQTPTDSNLVGSDSWLAAGFTTGNNTSGYLLDSIQLGLTDAAGNPSDFTVMIYSKSSNPSAGLPGSSLGTLDGSLNPVTGGVYTYTDDSNITLSPNTVYFIVLTAATTVANGAYAWSFTSISSYNAEAGWLATVTLSSGNGLSWTRLGANPSYDFSLFGINATAIPEPSAWSLILLGGGILIYARRTFHA